MPTQVEERGGFVWLFWGDARLPAEERPPIPFTPELEDPEWKAVYGEIEFDCGHWGEWCRKGLLLMRMAERTCCTTPQPAASHTPHTLQTHCRRV
jgi:hypothetical protein